MKTALRIATAAGVMMGGILLSGPASAQVRNCLPQEALLPWLAGGPCTNGDKLYTPSRIGLDLGDPANIQLQIEQLVGAEEIHNFSVDPIVPLGLGVYTIQYTIEITPEGLANGKWFDRVSIGMDVPQEVEGVTFQKIVDLDDTAGGGFVLTAVDGGNDIVDLPGTPTKLWIYETVTIAPTGFINSFTDTYIQNRTPEPGTLALLGLGLAGLGFARRRKR